MEAFGRRQSLAETSPHAARRAGSTISSGTALQWREAVQHGRGQRAGLKWRGAGKQTCGCNRRGGAFGPLRTYVTLPDAAPQLRQSANRAELRIYQCRRRGLPGLLSNLSQSAHPAHSYWSELSVSGLQQVRKRLLQLFIQNLHH